MEEGSRVTQSLNFLWFYTNVFTFTNNVPSTTRANNEPDNAQHKHGEGSLTPTTIKCHNCGEIISSSVAFGEESVVVEPKKKRRSDKYSSRRANVVKAMMKFDDEHQSKLVPPFDDDEAMKRHLKSWAYAVARMHSQIMKIRNTHH
ncbi:hypothetical protein PIB30_007781 [Stylosanthes scabra]|uniref:Uncharacterized protein n=1 Tax=Stylosanthes scabra TaxID=79078 RepID=A0ABU6Z1D7_9FABA|nr:hypothetical protein [Stylosanthes scabra]